MKASCVFAVLTLSVVVNGAWWTAAIQPIVLSFGAALAAFNLDVQPLFDIDLKSWQIFKQEQEELPKLARGEFIEELEKLKKKSKNPNGQEGEEVQSETVVLKGDATDAKFIVDLQQ